MGLDSRKLTFARLEAHRQRAHRLPLNPESDRYVILSDAHKSDRGAGDLFQAVEGIYCSALSYYAIRSFALILAGDIEAGAGNRLVEAAACYPNTYAQEKLFLPDRYFRITGNADHDWEKKALRRTGLDRALGMEVPVYPAVRLGERILVVHGHEGDLLADEPQGLTQRLLRCRKRLWAKWTGRGLSTADHFRWRGRRAQLLLEWAETSRTLLIAGHTHLAYFASQSLTRLLEKKIAELEDSLVVEPNAHAATGRITELSRAQKALATQDLFHDRGESLADGVRPLYFNTGCCRYADGLTGIEIAAGSISLVKWSTFGNGGIFRVPFATRRLSELLQKI